MLLQDVRVIRKRSFMRMPNTIAVSSSSGHAQRQAHQQRQQGMQASGPQSRSSRCKQTVQTHLLTRAAAAAAATCHALPYSTLDSTCISSKCTPATQLKLQLHAPGAHISSLLAAPACLIPPLFSAAPCLLPTATCFVLPGGAL
jgi:hypothetical protein